jgi:hypothetical protein
MLNTAIYQPLIHKLLKGGVDRARFRLPEAREHVIEAMNNIVAIIWALAEN